MDTLTPIDDPLECEISAIEAAISNDNADIAELEALLVAKRKNLQTLSVELRALKRAASLRPATMGGKLPPQMSSMAPMPTMPPMPTLTQAAPQQQQAPQRPAPEPEPQRFRPSGRPVELRPMTRTSDSTFM